MDHMLMIEWHTQLNFQSKFVVKVKLNTRSASYWLINTSKLNDSMLCKCFKVSWKWWKRKKKHISLIWFDKADKFCRKICAQVFDEYYFCRINHSKWNKIDFQLEFLQNLLYRANAATRMSATLKPFQFSFWERIWRSSVSELWFEPIQR